jgi:macrodomain Ter protein organizer (MatP/YcbG family)
MKGYKPAEEGSKRLSVTLSSAVLARLEKLATRKQWSLSNAASYLVEEGLKDKS